MPSPPSLPQADLDALLAFLRERDVPCPLCRYNLRNLTGRECPECRQALVLTVGIERPRIGWLLLTIVPGAFSGIAAVLLLIPIVTVPLLGGPAAPWFILAVDAFGWLSGFGALVLVRSRYAFLRQSPPAQRVWAAAAWGVHLVMFLVLVGLVFL